MMMHNPIRDTTTTAQRCTCIEGWILPKRALFFLYSHIVDRYCRAALLLCHRGGMSPWVMCHCVAFECTNDTLFLSLSPYVRQKRETHTCVRWPTKDCSAYARCHPGV